MVFSGAENKKIHRAGFLNAIDETRAPAIKSIVQIFDATYGTVRDATALRANLTGAVRASVFTRPTCRQKKLEKDSSRAYRKTSCLRRGA